jgi:hypothetical protein
MMVWRVNFDVTILVFPTTALPFWMILGRARPAPLAFYPIPRQGFRHQLPSYTRITSRGKVLRYLLMRVASLYKFL